MDFWHIPQWAQRKTKVHRHIWSVQFNRKQKNVQPNRRNDESHAYSWRLDNSSWSETSFDYNNKLVCASITQRVYKNNCIGAVCCCVHNFVTKLVKLLLLPPLHGEKESRLFSQCSSSSSFDGSSGCDVPLPPPAIRLPPVVFSSFFRSGERKKKKG